MEVIHCNLKILPISDLQNETLQKCLVPRDIFKANILPGTLARCFNSIQDQFICRIYPMDNEYSISYCYFDTVVKLKKYHKVNKLSQSLSLETIQPIEMESDDVESILIEITINENIFELAKNQNKEILTKIIQNLLEPYILVNNFTVQFDDFGISLGFNEIHVLKANSLKGFQVNSKTKIVIENIKMGEINFLKYSRLEGLDDQIKELNTITKILQNHKIQNLKFNLSLNVLIIGPTGSGKTSICHNFFMANKCNTFLIRSADIIRQYPGETEEVLRNIFENAKTLVNTLQPKDTTVIFIEDLELICPIVDDRSDISHENRISSQLIKLLDELHSNSYEIIVLATTSNIDMINGALRRPGRFEKEIYLPTLNEQNRERVLNMFLSSTPFSIPNIFYEKLPKIVAQKTAGYVGADLLLLVQNVVQNILRRKIAFGIEENELISIFSDHIKMIKPASIRGTDVTVYKCDMTFDNIGGMNSLKKTLETSVLMGLKYAASYQRFGLELPKGILLYGPPGCAKTTIAKCLANEANMTFIITSGAEVYSPYVGCAEKFIAKIFDTARKNAPCLIFFDEIDSLVGKRTSTSKSDVQTRILSTLLTEMDGIGIKMDSGILKPKENNILVVAATNRPDMIDAALMRPGRFDKLIHVPAPDFLSRLEIFKIHKNKMPFNENIDLEKLSKSTEHYSGADLCNLCNEAALHAFTNNFNTNEINLNDFEYVLDTIKPSLSEEQIQWYNSFEKKYKR